MKKEEGSILTIKDLEYLSSVLSKGRRLGNNNGILLWKIVDGSLEEHTVKTKKDLLKVIKNKQ